MMILISGALLAGAWFVLVPQGVSGIASRPDPARSYADACERAERFRRERTAGMNPLCGLELMTHGEKTARVHILVHGYTSCPQQFRELGKRLFASGGNVLIAPMPHHGLLDRMTEDHALLRAEELASYGDRVVDIASGLGDEVVMTGISAGGVTTAWAAQHRKEVGLAMIISPAFGFREIPTPLTAAVMNIFSVLPDDFTWWDPGQKADAPPPYAYPRYSRHALANILRLGFAVQHGMKHSPPSAQRIVMVTNANDDKVNNDLAGEIVHRWRDAGANVETFEFEASLDLGHDLIDPDQPDEKIDIVYPKLIELMGG